MSEGKIKEDNRLRTFYILADAEIKLIGEVDSQQEVGDSLEFIESFVYPNEVSRDLEISEWADLCHKVTNIQIEDEKGRTYEVLRKTRKRTFFLGIMGAIVGYSLATVQSEGLWLAVIVGATLPVLCSLILRRRTLRRRLLRVVNSEADKLFVSGSEFGLEGAGFISATIDASDTDEALRKFKIALGIEEAKENVEISLGGSIFLEEVREVYKLDQDQERTGANIYSRPLKFIRWLSSSIEVFFMFVPIGIFALLGLMK